ncbi:MFS transporter [Nesterenkonia xinjiangensis]|uniref:MFS family permease n=1 Tax=Nesterenkonia xinjiangensis TaxID=225327 RepID=A0A7Z0GMS1_9MICC|nr:MFS family permease [Nesterenkonia xinjiangensis]
MMTTLESDRQDGPRPGLHDDGPSLFRAAGPSYFPVALIARFPYAMIVVGVLTLVVSARGSLGLGGLTSAMVGLGAVLCAPLVGAAADRWGQRVVILCAGLASTVTLLVMAWVAYSPLPDYAVLISALLIGATTPQIPPMSRTRLVGIILRRLPIARQNRTLSRTMAYESAADEVTFVFGPMIVGILAAMINPAAPVVGAALLTLVFVTSFALHRSVQAVRPVQGERALAAPVRDLFRGSLLTVLVGALGIGLFFGAVLTSLTSFMSDAGQGESAGLVYGVMGIGSAAFALGSGLFPERFSLRARWLVFAGLMLAGTLMLPFVTGLGGMLAVLGLIGIGLGPTLVTVFSLVSARSPRGRAATAMTVATTGIVVGQSASSALVGQVGEHLGTGVALVAPMLAAAVVLGAGTVNWRMAASETITR